MIQACAPVGTPAGADSEMRDLLLGAIPALRAFAFSLTYDFDRTDDLVQDTLMRAWTKAESFRRGTNLTAWLFTILRNLFYSEQRKRKREVEDADGSHAGRLTSLPEQEVRVEMRAFQSALNLLPLAQREALVLVGAQSFTYEEAAEICGVAVGTIKSRVSRARGRLIETLGMDGAGDVGADAHTRAALQAG
ncbi:ECF RNA polymerase sigma factor EcfG [Methylobacterium cerastii]|uniref:RNA polymerase sigma factor n=1 Tax=Methylobacterium cerastii TaxID=932741 RepID=A0ABQ4QH02_9HYPH|nr:MULTISPECIES: sigma-70 family RNA polymerase sigma factor [Methylobacterium]TXM89860.1 sigma-70 family RNA polymerase sigma factor [Methylobacterium sp. WL122]TXM63695.1 sigma-70 family RNA polymerase sigma factor [Methylobacterium sp. WL120]TXM70501.1 sigma-70 family RNA polymerase sigma factor [Methylobacterium sp. WL12]TXM95909.1 sigma-70 family RNA polymerase sigma factor [Methylobacterium sp. WL103]TXN83507.1 sigma-70 family RNA polymerase sigma factor [Methylobacterium sp. WL8]